MINFFTEETSFKLKGKLLIKRWLKEVAEGQGYKISELNYIFCSDNYLLEINKQYLGHDYYTDIITFDNRDNLSEKIVLGDIFISVDTVSVNGTEYGEGFEREMLRVIAHGLLHLIGYDDVTEDLQLEMRAAENVALEKFDIIKAK
ncbi:MAG: rRNA maturation RNase YbeY [Bacteroidales bacterium]|nr:rRNA maturation RNase YbeY [Bacteroidales bacterium]